MRLHPDCELCTDVASAASLTLVGEPARDYAAASANQSHWAKLPAYPGAAVPSVQQLPARESYEQAPTFVWATPPAAAAEPSDSNSAGHGARVLREVGLLALEVDLALVPSLAADTQRLVPVPATVVLGIAAKVSCDGCALHLLVGSGSGGWVKSKAVNHTADVWGEHTFARTLSGEQGSSGVVRFGLVLQLGDSAGLPPGSPLATLSGFSLRRLGSTPLHR